MSYVVEGKTGKQFTDTKRLMFAAPELAHQLLGKLADTCIAYLSAQVRAGAQALQLFDSWVGQLAPEDFRVFAAPYVARVIAALRPLGVPLIYFANDAATLYRDAASLGADALGIDWRTPLGQARAQVGDGVTLQGNLDPCVLFAPIPEIERRAAAVLQEAAGTRHVFNLGHGILPPTPTEHAVALVEIVHRLGAR
jgi:uroporphyrinogen decarboxylase